MLSKIDDTLTDLYIQVCGLWKFQSVYHYLGILYLHLLDLLTHDDTSSVSVSQY